MLIHRLHRLCLSWSRVFVRVVVACGVPWRQFCMANWEFDRFNGQLLLPDLKIYSSLRKWQRTSSKPSKTRFISQQNSARAVRSSPVSFPTWTESISCRFWCHFQLSFSQPKNYFMAANFTAAIPHSGQNPHLVLSLWKIHSKWLYSISKLAEIDELPSLTPNFNRPFWNLKISSKLPKTQ